MRTHARRRRWGCGGKSGLVGLGVRGATEGGYKVLRRPSRKRALIFHFLVACSFLSCAPLSRFVQMLISVRRTDPSLTHAGFQGLRASRRHFRICLWEGWCATQSLENPSQAGNSLLSLHLSSGRAKEAAEFGSLPRVSASSCGRARCRGSNGTGKLTSLNREP